MFSSLARGFIPIRLQVLDRNGKVEESVNRVKLSSTVGFFLNSIVYRVGVGSGACTLYTEKGDLLNDMGARLSTYDIKPNDVIQVRRCVPALVTVCINTTKQIFQVNMGEPVREITGQICKESGIRDPENYGLAVIHENSLWTKTKTGVGHSYNWLSPDLSMESLRLKNNAELHLLKLPQKESTSTEAFSQLILSDNLTVGLKKPDTASRVERVKTPKSVSESGVKSPIMDSCMFDPDTGIPLYRSPGSRETSPRPRSFSSPPTNTPPPLKPRPKSQIITSSVHKTGQFEVSTFPRQEEAKRFQPHPTPKTTSSDLSPEKRRVSDRTQLKDREKYELTILEVLNEDTSSVGTVQSNGEENTHKSHSDKSPQSEGDNMEGSFVSHLEESNSIIEVAPMITQASRPGFSGDEEYEIHTGDKEKELHQKNGEIEAQQVNEVTEFFHQEEEVKESPQVVELTRSGLEDAALQDLDEAIKKGNESTSMDGTSGHSIASVATLKWESPDTCETQPITSTPKTQIGGDAILENGRSGPSLPEIETDESVIHPLPQERSSVTELINGKDIIEEYVEPVLMQTPPKSTFLENPASTEGSVVGNEEEVGTVAEDKHVPEEDKGIEIPNRTFIKESQASFASQTDSLLEFERLENAIKTQNEHSDTIHEISGNDSGIQVTKPPSPPPTTPLTMKPTAEYSFEMQGQLQHASEKLREFSDSEQKRDDGKEIHSPIDVIVKQVVRQEEDHCELDFEKEYDENSKDLDKESILKKYVLPRSLENLRDDDKDSLHSEGNTGKTTDVSTQVTDQTESTEYQPKEEKQQGKGSYEAAVAIGTNNIHIQEAEGPFDRLGECEKQKEHFDHLYGYKSNKDDTSVSSSREELIYPKPKPPTLPAKTKMQSTFIRIPVEDVKPPAYNGNDNISMGEDEVFGPEGGVASANEREILFPVNLPDIRTPSWSLLDTESEGRRSERVINSTDTLLSSRGYDSSLEGQLDKESTVAGLASHTVPRRKKKLVHDSKERYRRSLPGASTEYGEEEAERTSITSADVRLTKRGSKKFQEQVELDYYKMSYSEVLGNHHLMHFVILDQDIRPFLVNAKKTVKEIITELCSTFGIPNQSEWFLCMPKGLQVVLSRVNSGSRSTILGLETSSVGVSKKTKFILGSELISKDQILSQGKTLQDQYDFTHKPYIIHMRKRVPKLLESIDGVLEECDIGCEWPEGEESAKTRCFFQSWCSITQGHAPVEKHIAAEIAALILQAQFGDYSKIKRQWKDSVNVFLPEMYKHKQTVQKQVKRIYKRLKGITAEHATKAVVNRFREQPGCDGVFFPVKIAPERKFKFQVSKLKPGVFGLSSKEILCLDYKTSQVILRRNYHEVQNFEASKRHFLINFGGHYFEPFAAATPMAFEVMNCMKLFIQMQPIPIQNQPHYKAYSVSQSSVPTPNEPVLEMIQV